MEVSDVTLIASHGISKNKTVIKQQEYSVKNHRQTNIIIHAAVKTSLSNSVYFGAD